MKLYALACSLALAVLAGCAVAPPAPAEPAVPAPVCSGERDCTVKWDAAQVWVATNAGMKIQTVTSAIIQTFNPSNATTALAVQVVKQPVGDGKYRIAARIWCDNWIGCSRPPAEALADFNRAVAAAQ